ncbi:hypothetical protein F4808DRAFT_445752 [Astrocystis sublimbata]|nr:hypothetical protein F4808DRAFT_445752 [Astrocystis sublimbata]
MLFSQRHVLIFAMSLQQVLGLLRPVHRQTTNSTDQYPQVILGPEGSDPSTTEYQLNHASLNTNNLTRSVDFYTKVFGLRVIATLQLTKHFSTTYLGYSFAGRNGTGYMTSEELLQQMHNAQGLLELLYLDAPDNDLPASTQNTNTFSHMGFVVPDTTVTQKRLEDFGATFYKKIGEPSPEDGPYAVAINLVRSKVDPTEFATLHATLSSAQKSYIFAADPDGNMLEILPQMG